MKLPEGWRKVALRQVAEVRTGLALGRVSLRDPIRLPYLRVANVQDGHLDLTEIKTVEVNRDEVARYSLRAGDVLLTEGGDFDKLGRGTVWHGEIPDSLHQNHVFCVRAVSGELDPYYFSCLTSSPFGRSYFLGCAKKSTNLASINSTQLKEMPLPLPSLDEQLAIGERLLCWDQGIRKLTNLITSKIRLRKGLQQQLLTGRRRFREFVIANEVRDSHFGPRPIDWTLQTIGTFAKEVRELNLGNNGFPVLSCTKHQGLVEAHKYFGRRMHGEDISRYKVIRKGQFAYATNHIEEGSIGLLTRLKSGLISPMYTVFQADDRVHGPYLFLLFKTELYRQTFAANTNGSVNRRGGLRWSQFSRLEVALPPLPEQLRICDVFSNLEHEIQLRKQELAALVSQKKGLMQKLLTGQVRVRA